jgi:hypothetical protein
MQTLGDGTEISKSESDLFYRDSAGRTRIETPALSRVLIVDPVAHVSVSLNTATKTARRVSLSSIPVASKVEAATSAGGFTRSTTTTFVTTVGDSTTAIVTGGEAAGPMVTRRGQAVSDQNMKHEELGAQSLNGVLATGTRNTLTIPQGQIGNNRDIHVVNERWYSDELQMLVMTVNSDPRFGENTYEFTNVSRDEPDASLFQIPADYDVVDIGAGRGVRTVPAPVTNK